MTFKKHKSSWKRLLENLQLLKVFPIFPASKPLPLCHDPLQRRLPHHQKVRLNLLEWISGWMDQPPFIGSTWNITTPTREDLVKKTEYIGINYALKQASSVTSKKPLRIKSKPKKKATSPKRKTKRPPKKQKKNSVLSLEPPFFGQEPPPPGASRAGPWSRTGRRRPRSSLASSSDKCGFQGGLKNTGVLWCWASLKGSKESFQKKRFWAPVFLRAPGCENTPATYLVCSC